MTNMKTVLQRCFEFAVFGVVTWRVWIEAGPVTSIVIAAGMVIVVSLNRYKDVNDKAWTALIEKIKKGRKS